MKIKDTSSKADRQHNYTAVNYQFSNPSPPSLSTTSTSSATMVLHDHSRSLKAIFSDEEH